ncbi:MAG: sigma-70 family RNA polymerase sigma factor [Anaerolineales bacterium]|nr:sigma-70 family RNA polymerase sigma factor [Anaerolineales bacterium]
MEENLAVGKSDKNNSSDSRELYHACRYGSPQEQQAAYEILWPYLVRVTLQVLYDQANAESLAQECAQRAMIRVYKRIADCHEPAAFRTWVRRIGANLAIDELRRRKRLLPLDSVKEPDASDVLGTIDMETTVSQNLDLNQLRRLLNSSPMSERSRRLVIGRFLDDLPDEILAQQESDLADRAVRPSHIQVTRAKNIAKLREWEPIRLFFEER